MQDWYKLFKKATEEQQNFPFSKDPSLQQSKPNITPEQKQWMNRVSPTDIRSLISLLEETNSKEELLDVFKRVGYNFTLNEVQFDNGQVYVLSENSNNYLKKVYIIEDIDSYPTFKEAHEWLSDIYDHELDSYVPSEDFNKRFWDDVTNGSTLYHATHAENLDSVMKNGLQMKDESRGISNRSNGSAVFTSDNPNDIESYGDTVFEINLGQMKDDGYMPSVQMEGPLESSLQKQRIAYKIGLNEYNATDEYASEGLYESTVVIFGGIPAKYLSVYNG